jgi:hypothetical protein
MTDVVTPNFRAIIAKGGIVNNSCSYVKNTITCTGSGSGAHNNPGNTQGWTSYGYPTSYSAPVNPDATWPQIAWVKPSVKTVERAKLEALSRVDSSQYSFGEDTAELKETVRFLRHPVDSLLGLTRSHQKLLRKISRAKNTRNLSRSRQFEASLSNAAKMRSRIGAYKGNAKELASAYADVWASYSFAAAPLVRSCSDAIEAYHTLPDRVNVLGRMSAHSRSEDDWSGNWSGLPQVVGATTRKYTVSREWVESVHAMILYEVKSPIKDLKQGLGLRSKDFPVTMWQILPLSFMVDRLYDVSSFLKAAINIGDPKVKILAGSITTRRTLNSSIKLDSVTNASWPGNTTGETVHDEQFVYDRNPWTPSIRDAIPTFEKGGLIKDATKIADTLSIAVKLLL